VKLPDGSVQLVKPPFAGRLSGFTLLFEALVLMLAPEMPFAAVARIVGVSPHRVMAICRRYVALALAEADFSEVNMLAIDETSRARGHDYITLAADAVQRRVLSVTAGRDAKAIATIAAELAERGCPPEQIESVSIDMSPAFIKGVGEQLPNARITFDKFHVVWHANAAVDKMRRIEQRSDKSLKGMRWSLLKDRDSLKPEAVAELDALQHARDAGTAHALLARDHDFHARFREGLRHGLVRGNGDDAARARQLHFEAAIVRARRGIHADEKLPVQL
jgi:transposase